MRVDLEVLLKRVWKYQDIGQIFFSLFFDTCGQDLDPLARAVHIILITDCQACMIEAVRIFVDGGRLFTGVAIPKIPMPCMRIKIRQVCKPDPLRYTNSILFISPPCHRVIIEAKCIAWASVIGSQPIVRDVGCCS